VRTCVFLLVGLLACAIAARQVERWTRRSFLETRLLGELAANDELTGMKNRRVLDEHLARLWSQALQDKRSLAILLIDVDHFKSFNDCYGHQAGDLALRSVAQEAQRFVSRPLDVIARYGGEEFVAVFYDFDADQAVRVAEQMRRAIESLGIAHRGSRTAPRVTISIGIAVVQPTAGRARQGALQLADEALYEAKVKGRNRVELMTDAEHQLLVTGVFARSAQAT
jgi:diguanylate cyclase (GGDEF)-like protein